MSNERSEIKAPANIPQKGFYYHYKHDQSGLVNNYAYEVIGVGHHTEEDGTFFVIYRPIYKEASVYKAGKLFDLRPLESFLEPIEKDGKTFLRFNLIKTDSVVLLELQKIKIEMYGIGNNF